MKDKTKSDADRLVERKNNLEAIANNQALDAAQRKSQIISIINETMGASAAQSVSQVEELPKEIEDDLPNSPEGQSLLAAKEDKANVNWSAENIDAVYQASAALLADLYLETAVGSTEEVTQKAKGSRQNIELKKPKTNSAPINIPTRRGGVNNPRQSHGANETLPGGADK